MPGRSCLVLLAAFMTCLLAARAYANSSVTLTYTGTIGGFPATIRIEWRDTRIGVSPAGFLLPEGRDAWARRYAPSGLIRFGGEAILPDVRYTFKGEVQGGTPGGYADGWQSDSDFYRPIRILLEFPSDQNYIYIDRFSLTVEPQDRHAPTYEFHLAVHPPIVEPKPAVAPVLAAIPNRTAQDGKTVAFTISATDADLPAQALAYTLDPGTPPGAALDPATGAFSWTPTPSQGPGTYTFVVRVTDTGSPPLSATKAFTISVAPGATEPRLARLAVSADGVATVYWPATPGDSYRLLYKSTLDAPHWSLLGQLVATGNLAAMDDKSSASLPQRFYSVEFVPGVPPLEPAN